MTSMKQKSMRPGPSEITFKNMKFLIMDRPTDSTIPVLLEELRRRNVKDVVRVCEPTYSTELLENEGIKVFDWAFDDGFPPPAKIVEDWFDLLRTRFRDDPDGCVAVHCVAGLGRLESSRIVEDLFPLQTTIATLRRNPETVPKSSQDDGAGVTEQL